MKVSVLFFGHYADTLNQSQWELELPQSATLRKLLEYILERDARLVNLEQRCRFAVNEEFATLETLLSEGDVVAVLPPMSGG